MKSWGTVRLKVSVIMETPGGALTLIAFDGTETEQAADGALTEADVRPADEGMEPIVARSGDSPRLRQRGFSVTERDASGGRRSS